MLFGHHTHLVALVDMSHLMVSTLHLQFFGAIASQEFHVIHRRKHLRVQHAENSHLAALVHSLWFFQQSYLKVFHVLSFALPPSPHELLLIETMGKSASESSLHSSDLLQCVYTAVVFCGRQPGCYNNNLVCSQAEKQANLQER